MSNPVLRCTPTAFIRRGGGDGASLEIEDDTECRINAAHLVEAKEPDAQSAGVGFLDFDEMRRVDAALRIVLDL